MNIFTHNIKALLEGGQLKRTLANNSSAASGGGGAGYHAKIKINDGGYYIITAGAGGTSYGCNRGGSATGGAGEASVLRKENGAVIVSAGGGTGAVCNGGSSERSGTGGILTNYATATETYVSKNGNNGGTSHGSNSAAVGVVVGPISEHTWGQAANASGSANGGSAGSSKHGYAMLKYIGPIGGENTTRPGTGEKDPGDIPIPINI